MNGFNITYETVSPESAADGDAEDRGFIAEDLCLEDAYSALRFEGHAVQADCSHGTPRWLTFSPDTDYRTGAETTKSLHFPKGITPSSARRVARLFGLTR